MTADSPLSLSAFTSGIVSTTRIVWHRIHDANRSAIAPHRDHQLFGDFGRASVAGAAPQDERSWQGKLGGIQLAVLNEDEVLWRVTSEVLWRVTSKVERYLVTGFTAKHLGCDELESEVLEVGDAVPNNGRAPVEDRLAHLLVAALRLQQFEGPTALVLLLLVN